MNCLFGKIKLVSTVLMALICIQVGVPLVANAQSYSFINGRWKDKQPFSLVKNLIIIPVYLNNKGPYNFVLDTGVSLLLITDPGMADTLGLKNQRTIKISGYGGGDEIEASVTYDISASIGKLRLWEVPTAVLKNDIFDLSSYLGTKVHGLIGYPFFKELVVHINYGNNTISFQPDYMKIKRPGVAVPIELVDNKPYVRAKINGGHGDLDVKLILDNGASHALSLESYRGAPFPLPGKTIPANLGVGLGGRIAGRIGRSEMITIGPYSLKNVLSSFPAYDDVGGRSLQKDRHGNLGADLLRHFNVTFDYSNSVMYLRKNQHFNDLFEHDMSGMEIYLEESPDKGYFLGRIEPGSPAEKAGLLIGDQLMSIDLKPVQTFSLDEICSLLKSKDGRHLFFEINRNGARMMKMFKLEKRI